MVKNPPVNVEDTGDAGSSLGWVNPLEKEMTTYSSILAWKIPWTEEPGRQHSMGSQSQTCEMKIFPAILMGKNSHSHQ